MVLATANLRPGRVIELGEKGEIRVDSPGLFSMSDKDHLPWVKPFFTGNTGQYSMPEVFDEVWILDMKGNSAVYFWFKKDQYRDMDLTGEEVEIRCHRETGKGWATLKFSDGEGWILRSGSSTIQIDGKGDIRIGNGEPRREIHIHSDGIDLGGSSHKAAYGDVVVDCMNLIQNALEVIRQAASTNVYTQPIAQGLASIPKQLMKKIPDITSENVNLE